jgi:hypothetical protein
LQAAKIFKKRGVMMKKIKKITCFNFNSFNYASFNVGTASAKTTPS